MGSARASRMLLSRSVFSPSMTMLTSRPVCLAVSRTTRGRRRNICSTGTMRIFITARCSLLRICDWKSSTSAVLARSGRVAEAAIHLGEQLLHHALGDDELAHQIEDHVDALGLDADDVFGGGGGGARRGPWELLRLPATRLRGASLVLLALRDRGESLLGGEAAVGVGAAAARSSADAAGHAFRCSGLGSACSDRLRINAWRPRSEFCSCAPPSRVRDGWQGPPR